MRTKSSNFHNYISPSIDVIDIVVEAGYIASSDYGDVGSAGQDIGNNDYGEF